MLDEAADDVVAALDEPTVQAESIAVEESVADEAPASEENA